MLKLLIPLTLSLVITPHHWNKNIVMVSTLPVIALSKFPSEPWQLPINTIMSLDPLSTSLVILTLWITPLMFIASQKLLHQRNTSQLKFIKMVNMLSLILLMAFSVNNMFLFYIMFEASLLPTLMIILTWGYQPERIQAGMYLMMYTITGSIPLLMTIIFIYESNNSLNMNLNPTITIYPPSTFMWFLMNTAFMVKLPMFLSHLWLPKAHGEAPVAGSMILAAVLLKLGGYGMMRMTHFTAPLNKLPSHTLMTMALWGGALTSLMCVRQTDMKSLIAYSSVGHMSLVLAGVITNNLWGLQGALVMMIAHGLVSSAMFANANLSYEMSNSRNMIMNKGMHIMLPMSATLWFIMTAANMAAPPSINLLGEIMLIAATLSTFSMILPLSIMSFLSAAYSLLLYTTMNHGHYNSSTVILPHLKPNYSTSLILHLIPVLIIIASPMIIASW